jgi:hypothetical protein
MSRKTGTKWMLLLTAVVVLLGVVVLATLTPAQRPDRAFLAEVATPEFNAGGPVVAFDRVQQCPH